MKWRGGGGEYKKGGRGRGWGEIIKEENCRH